MRPLLTNTLGGEAIDCLCQPVGLCPSSDAVRTQYRRHGRLYRANTCISVSQVDGSASRVTNGPVPSVLFRCLVQHAEGTGHHGCRLVGIK